METEINVAATLKDKPQGVKLYSRICGAVELKEVLDVRNEFPDGYEIWAIGRRNFEHKGYVPLCEVDENYNVKRDTLKALKVKDEAFALALLYEAVKRGVNKKKYNKMLSA